MFMDVLNKRGPLFLQTLIERIILSMITWLKGYKYLQIIFKEQTLKVKNVHIFKYLNITMDKYMLHSIFYCMDINDVEIILGYPWME